MADWFNEKVAPDWMEDRQKMMSLLQDEAELEEIVKMVGMDALSAGDRLKMEAARSIREDFLHQNTAICVRLSLDGATCCALSGFVS